MTTNTALLILILADGSRITHEMASDASKPWRARVDQRNADLAAIGMSIGEQAGALRGSVLIDGTDVLQYTANETREVLGLE